MSKWKWLAGFGCLLLSMVACATREAEGPRGASSPRPTPAAGEPVARMVRNGPGISTLSAETNRDQFNAYLTDQLASIDGRIRTDTRLYEEVSAADKERTSERWQVALNKRAAIDENRKILDLAVGQDWALPKADIVTNLTILEKALDDVEFVFKR